MITVFLGTFNRLETLERTVLSYHRFKTPHELVIVDNGSDHPECQAFLRDLERNGRVKKVYRLPACETYPETTVNFNEAMTDQYHHGNAGKWFAVTDADVCFDGTDRRALEVYCRLARKLGTAVGPHLRVDASIPAAYPLRSRVLACETWMLYRRDMERLGRIFYSNTQIDTTFHLFTRRPEFDRLRMDPRRVAAPYDAMHLDWYLDVFHPNREQEILVPDERPLGSWAKSWIRDFWRWMRESPEVALKRLLDEPVDPTDLCNVSFILAWCYQYGVGCEVDLAESWAWLKDAIPFPNDRYWSLESDWRAMIYENDFSALEAVPDA